MAAVTKREVNGFIIEKGVTRERDTSGERRPYPFDSLEVEESFAVPATHKARIVSAVAYANKKHAGQRKFIWYREKTGGDIRVWRVS